MANYEYIAKNISGDQVAGVMQADNASAVVRALDERKLFPVRVAEQAPARERFSKKRIALREVGVMYGQLSDLLNAGVPILRAIDTLAKAVPNRRLADILRRVRDDISAGKNFADALREHPKVFSPLHSAMAQAGEQAGFLEDVLAKLSDFLDSQDDLRSKVRGAMIYPMLLCIGGSGALIGILVWLVPRFKPFFSGFPLPMPTRLLFGLSDLLVQRLPVLIGLIVLAAIGLRALLRSEFGRRVWDQWRMKIPFFGPTTQMVAIARFCRILGTMLINGVPILQALAISKGATGSACLGECIEQAAENVRAGEPLAEPLRRSGLFPAEIIEMIAVAEESNQLEKVLVQIADTVERRTSRKVDQAVRLIEPLILVFIATTIGFVAIGIMYPIFTMVRMLR